MNSSDPDSIPVVFLTGYKMDYGAGEATPVIKPYPVFTYDDGTWSQWWQRRPPGPPVLAVAFKNNGGKYILLDSNGVIPNVMSPGLNSAGRTYRQLTPDNALP